MTKKFTVEELLQQLMQGADKNYREGVKMLGTGFVVGAKRITKGVEQPADEGTSCGVINASMPVDSLDDLRRFSTAIRAAVKMSEATYAGVLCELVIALDEKPAEASVVLYLDQKFAGMRVWVAPKTGEHLTFRDLGVAHPTTSFLPSLFPTDIYGPSIADA